jgi:hypothetical protein
VADFCKQCSLATFGSDFGELAGLMTKEEAAKGYMATVLCEGCGPIQVNNAGECLSADCLECHGVKHENSK